MSQPTDGGVLHLALRSFLVLLASFFHSPLSSKLPQSQADTTPPLRSKLCYFLHTLF